MRARRPTTAAEPTTTEPVAVEPAAVEPRPEPPAGRYQAFISAAFLLVLVLTACQYALVKYGSAWVVLAPIGWAGPEAIAEEAPDQAPGLYVIDWGTWDQVAYRLDEGTTLPPAEGLAALLALLALPLLFLLGRRQVWPRWPLWALVGVAALAVLNADDFRPAVMELAQIVLSFLVVYWLAGAALISADQLKRAVTWLGALTVLLLLYGLWHYATNVYLAPDGAADPTAVRATYMSRTSYSGAMLLLLCLAFGRVLDGGKPLATLGWLVVVGAGAVVLLNGGALLALGVAMIAMATLKGRLGGFILAAVVVPLALLGIVWQASTPHLDLLQRSIDPVHRAPDGVPYQVEKRYLEMAAALNALGARRAILTPDTEQPDGGLREVEHKRSVAVLGLGPGANYQRNIGQFYLSLDNPEKQEPDTYNLYLLLAAQLGLFGALAWAWVLLDGSAAAREAFEETVDPGLRALELGIYGALIGLVVFSLFGTVLVRSVWLLVTILLAMGARLHALNRPVVVVAPTPKPVVVEPEPEAAAIAEPTATEAVVTEPVATEPVVTEPVDAAPPTEAPPPPPSEPKKPAAGLTEAEWDALFKASQEEDTNRPPPEQA